MFRKTVLPVSLVLFTACSVNAEHPAPNDLSSLVSFNALITEIPEREAVNENNNFETVSPFFVVKDNIHVSQIPNTAGTPGLRNFVPTKNNETVQRLLDAGAVPVAKTNMHELAFGVTSNNAAFGAVRNFHDPDRFAGGSSGGTAVAIASGLVEWGLCTDTGGSCRIPAALNGIVGYRPSMGRYPTEAVTPLSQTHDTVGLMTENVGKLAYLDGLLTPDHHLFTDGNSSYRLGIPRNYFYENLESDVAEVTERFLNQLEASNMEIVELDLSAIAGEVATTSLTIVLHESPMVLRAYLQRYYPQLSLEELITQVASADVAGVLNLSVDEAVSLEDYQQALTKRDELITALTSIMIEQGIDALVYPTLPVTARLIQNESDTLRLNGVNMPTFNVLTRNTNPASLLGFPAITLPAGMASNDLPVGLEVTGVAGSDRKLIAIAMRLEQTINNSD